MPVTYEPSPVDTMFALITASWGRCPVILDGDDAARALSGGSFNSLYYEALWHETEGFTEERLDSATVVTASCVYTAWVDAGRPPVPGSTVAVASQPEAAGRLQAGPSPFREALTVRYDGEGPLRLDVFDVRGAHVGTLVTDARGPGSVVWRPTLREGGPASSGVFFLRLTGPRASRVLRVARVR